MSVPPAAAPPAAVEPDAAIRIAELFRLLGDPTRVRLLYALAAGERYVGDLAAEIGVAETSVSHALRLLRTARVVRVRRAGRLAYYRLDDDHVRVLLEVCRAHLGHDGAEVHPPPS